MSEITYSSASALAVLIRSKKVSSVEVVDAHIGRIEAVNPKLNAVVQLAAEQARGAAKEADATLAKGEAVGPLHDVPFTVKDAIESVGVINTSGTLGRKAYMPDRDATVIRRLRGAGAILLGNTNVPELCLGGESDNLVYGRTSNPYDLTCTTGGSSGGEAAIIAAGGSPLGLGSDVGGSIRQPSHFCGIAGIKPTIGRVPTTGHFPSLDGLLGPMFKIGPMARSVDDLTLALGVIAGPDWRDPYTRDVPLGDPSALVNGGLKLSADIGGLRVGVHTDNGTNPADADTVATVEAAAQALTEAGASVDEARPVGAESANELFFDILQADAGAGVRALLAGAGTTESHPLLQLWLDKQGDAPLSAGDFGALLERLDRWRGGMTRFLENHDAILCPVWATPTVPHGTLVERGWPGASYTRQFNLTGWPSAVVRAGTSSNGGLPIGVQLAARPFREDVALALAKAVEEALGGYRPPAL